MHLSTPYALAPSILSADFTRLGAEIRAVSQAGAHLIHVDVMDGQFVPNLTIGPDVVAALRTVTQVPLDVHLMIAQPERYVARFVEAGASIVTVHAEACIHLHRTLQQIRECGAKAGVAINPATSLSCLDHVLDAVDLILIMTVNPGFGGQKPIRSAIDKLVQVKERLARSYLAVPPLLEVDGGVKLDNLKDFAAADILVSGSGIFHFPETEGLRKVTMTEAELAASYTRIMSAMGARFKEARDPGGPMILPGG